MRKFVLGVILLSALYANASLSSAVTVSTISCSGTPQVCTGTTSTAHNIASSNPGFVLAGGPTADVLAGTAASVPSSTTFTFNCSSCTTCSSSCGTAQPAPNFIEIGAGIPSSGFGMQIYTACVWIYVATPVPAPGKTTQCSSEISSSPEASYLSSINNALAAGTWQEVVPTIFVSLRDTRATIEQEWQNVQFAAQLQLGSGLALIQPGRDIGTMCDVVGCNQ